MKGYKTYFDRQEPSEALHARLLALGAEPVPKAGKKGGSRMKLTTLAACAALLIGLGGRLWSPAAPGPVVPAATETPAPTQSPETAHGFVARGPEEGGGKAAFPAIFGLDFADLTGSGQLAYDIALPDGAFWAELDKEDILKLFWGPGGRPEDCNTGDFPLMLTGWAGYTISATACYDGEGDLWQLTLRGEKGEASFTLRAAPGAIPPTCVVEEGGAINLVLDTAVTAWSRQYDLDGDGKKELVLTSQFMAGDVGVQFSSVSPAEEEDAVLFHSMTVTQLLPADGGLYLDHIAHREDIPAWSEETFETPAQSASSPAWSDFAPYLPTRGPEGFGDFFGRRSYQAGDHDTLFFRWSRGYDDVEVEVYLPEGDSTARFSDSLVDAALPESYDWRLYDGPIHDAVPEEYREHFYAPTFRAEDMSLDVVEARMTAKDTGGESCVFSVLHPNGVAVVYHCAGVSPQYVWDMVAATLER